MKQTELKRKTQLKAKTPLQARVKLKQKSALKQSKSRKCGSKRKKPKKTESIMHTKDGTCYLCMLLNDNNVRHEYTEEHHVFFGTAKRRLSEEHGLKVYLCMDHHTGSIKGNKMAVHHNHKVNLLLRAAGQRAFEQTHTRQEFQTIFQENHLIGDKEGEQICLINLESLIP